MSDIQLTDEVVIPVMEKHKINRDEAEKRLQLLYKSSILSTCDIEQSETKRLIDNFLAQDSRTLQGAVNYEKILNKCLANTYLVRQYDRLYHCNLTKTLRKVNAGLPPPANFKRQIKGFEKFLEKMAW